MGRRSASLHSWQPTPNPGEGDPLLTAPAPQPTSDESRRASATPMSEDDVAQVVTGIGPRLRALRTRQGLSLQQLADQSGVSPAAIHKVEQSTMVPTITTLLKLAATFDVPVGHFIDEAPAPASSAVHVPAKRRRQVTSAAGDIVTGQLSADGGPFDLDATLSEVGPGASSGEATARSAGETLVHVVSGSLEVTVSGQPIKLSTGDSLHFRAEEPHSWRNPGARVAKVIFASVPERR